MGYEALPDDKDEIILAILADKFVKFFYLLITTLARPSESSHCRNIN